MADLLAVGAAERVHGSSAVSRVRLAMADDYPGMPARDPVLGSWPVGIAVFAVIVNPSNAMTHFTGEQLRTLYTGKAAQWNDHGLDGSAGEVVLVSRTPNSGTRDAFENRVLHHAESAPVSSSDCLVKDLVLDAPVKHCEVATTADVVEKVRATPGAIGYVSAAEAGTITDGSLRVVMVDGYPPSKENVADGSYKFWAVERVYRYGPQLPWTSRDNFVQYITTHPTARAILNRYGFYRCDDPEFVGGEVVTACQQLNATTPTPTPAPSTPSTP